MKKESRILLKKFNSIKFILFFIYIDINMDIIKIILIIGLVYISLQQKPDSTRNMMLIITGLLVFCMLGKVEGYCKIPKRFFREGALVARDGRYLEVGQNNWQTEWESIQWPGGGADKSFGNSGDGDFTIS